MAGDKHEAKVDLSRIMLRVDASWSPGKMTAAGVAAPADVSNRFAGNYLTLKIPANIDPFEYMRRIENMPGVQWARFEIVGRYYLSPSDPYFSQQWNLSTAHVPNAWNLVSASSSVKVGVIDSPIDAGHPDLPSITRLGGDATPAFYHGTGVCGIVFGRTDNGIGMAGVASGVSTYNWGLPTNEEGFPNWGETDVVNAIYAMANAGVRVINLSLGYGNPNALNFPATVTAIDYATGTKNAVIVCASGNLVGSPTDFPANEGNVIAVSAVWTDGNAYGQSGPKIDVVAPGWLDIITTDVRGCPEAGGSGGLDEGDYMGVDDDPNCDFCGGGSACPVAFGGTSAAAPFVSGVAALILSANPNLTWSQVRDVIRNTAEKLPGMNGQNYTNSYGYGRINAEAAVASVLGTTSTTYHGTITQNTTWPVHVLLDGDVEVAQGATLTIPAGTTVRFAATDAADLEPFFTDRVELHVKGALAVNGTSTAPVVFRSDKSTPTDHDWVHIQVLSGSLTMNYAQLRHSEWGISSLSGVSISNSSFDTNQHNIRLGGTATNCSVTGCSIQVVPGTAIELLGADATISNNYITLTGSSSCGIKVDNVGSSATIDDNQITGPSSTPYPTAGIWLNAGTSQVTGNTIQKCTDGIYVKNGTHTIGVHNGENTITLNTNGIHASCGIGTCPTCPDLAVTVRRNTITNNTNAGVLSDNGTFQLDLGTNDKQQAGKNTFTGNGVYCISNSSTCQTIMARGNYFGSCPPPSCTSGSVDVSSALCSPPTSSPAPQPEVATPARSGLLPNVPNPFNPETQIRFALREPAVSRLEIYNVAGQLVRRVDLGMRNAGEHAWTWTGRNDHGAAVSSGIYFVTLHAGSVTDRRKIVMLK
jgi:subtilisin family serine protease